MDTDKIAAAPVSRWNPESDPVRLAIFGKMVEETGELLAQVGRAICQGLDGLDPVSGKPENEVRLRAEMADVRATCATLQGHIANREHARNGPMSASMQMEEDRQRAHRKAEYLGAWHRLIDTRDYDALNAAPPSSRAVQFWGRPESGR